MNFHKQIMLRNTQLYILVIALLIASLGIISIYSSTHQKDGELWQSIYKRQIIWVLLGVAAYLLMSNFNYRILWDATYFLYSCAVVLLLLVVILGSVRLGAQRWLRFAWFNFQPAEIVKLIVVIFLSRYFSQKSAVDIGLRVARLGITRALIWPFVLVAIPMFLIIEQPDLGSGMLVFLIFMGIIFLAGVRKKYILIALLVIAALCPLVWHGLRDYQRDRLLVFVNPNIDPLGAGYTIIQSKIAVGSGDFLGKGWLAGTQSQLRFLPESHTDFIFATYAEERGFLGVLFLFLLYGALLTRGISLAGKTRDQFGKLLGYGVCLMLALQSFVNIAMNVGLAPVVGIPLPLMSYGGSSVIVSFVALGILVNIGKTRAVF